MGAACLAVQSPSAAESRRAAAGDTAQVSTKAKAKPSPATAPAPSPAAAPVAQPTPAPAAAPADSAKPAPLPTPAAPAAAVPVAVDSTQKLIAPAPIPADSAAKPVAVDSAQAAPAAAAPAIDYGDSAKAPESRKKKKRIVRETTVNTIDELKGKYRSPKKALFMSLVVPGLGQAYVGQSWFNYARGAAYLLTDVGLALGWHHYVVTKQDRQIARYRAFADTNWRVSRYEDSVSKHTDKGKFGDRFPHRESYCGSVQSDEGSTGARLFRGCNNPVDNATEYEEFKNAQSDRDLPTDTVAARRKEFPNAHNFYELIGKEVEFIWGWSDAENIVVGDDGAFTMDQGGTKVPATTALQQEYIGMRAKANDYARMQAWFLGGMVLNHLVSALDAAFTAHVHNKSLYQTEVGFLERLRLDSFMAWDGYAPVPTVMATYTF